MLMKATPFLSPDFQQRSHEPQGGDECAGGYRILKGGDFLNLSDPRRHFTFGKLEHDLLIEEIQR